MQCCPNFFLHLFSLKKVIIPSVILKKQQVQHIELDTCANYWTIDFTHCWWLLLLWSAPFPLQVVHFFFLPCFLFWYCIFFKLLLKFRHISCESKFKKTYKCGLTCEGIFWFFPLFPPEKSLMSPWRLRKFYLMFLCNNLLHHINQNKLIAFFLLILFPCITYVP